MFAIDDVDRMTGELGEDWGYAHVRRVLRLVGLIGGDVEVLTWAVYLHDWGAFPRYAQAGVPHALRSRQIAEAEILPQRTGGWSDYLVLSDPNFTEYRARQEKCLFVVTNKLG